jgi:redox-sensitive bicupin YhaK (pirin superfamily)
MQTIIHRAEERGGGDFGWLRTRHSFSFAQWYEPTRMGFGALRVLNDDTILPGSGFGTHGHDNMEIITVVTQGTLAHKDSTGGEGRMHAGEVQVMSAGTGVLHSEYNGGDDTLTLFQIWIVPNESGVAPRYAERALPTTGAETLLVAPWDTDYDVLTIHQDAYISRIALDAGELHTYTLKNPNHGVYFFVMQGKVSIAGTLLANRDGIGVQDASDVALSTDDERTMVLAIEVPMH